MQRLRSLSLVALAAAVFIGCDSNDNTTVELPLPREVAEGDYLVTDSGLKIYDFTVGGGAEAQPGFGVVVDYALWLEDGTLIESSILRGQPFSAVLGQGSVIQGWEEGLVGMRVGGDRQLVVPPQLAYGEAGLPGAGIPAGTDLIFEIVLIEVFVPADF